MTGWGALLTARRRIPPLPSLEQIPEEVRRRRAEIIMEPADERGI